MTRCTVGQKLHFIPLCTSMQCLCLFKGFVEGLDLINVQICPLLTPDLRAPPRHPRGPQSQQYMNYRTPEQAPSDHKLAPYYMYRLYRPLEIYRSLPMCQWQVRSVRGPCTSCHVGICTLCAGMRTACAIWKQATCPVLTFRSLLEDGQP